MSRLKIAVIGVGAHRGSRARQYLETIARLPEYYELVVCDRNPEALNEAALECGATARYGDIRTLFSSEKPDVVLSMTPKDSHLVIALTAARHGAHVITEIPVGLTRRYAEAVAQTCREQGVLWEVAEQVWLWPVERLKRKVIEAGLLGELTHARLWYLTGQYHGFNAVRSLLGAEAKRVLGYCGEVATQPYTAYGGEPETTIKWDHAVVEFGNGVACLFEKPPRIFPSAAHNFPTGWQVEGTRGYWDRSRLVLYGKDAAETFEIVEEYGEVDGRRVLETVRVETDSPVVWENPYRSLGIGAPDDVSKASILLSFHEAITTGGKPQYGHENALRDWEICLAVRESARRGSTWLDLPLTEPTELEQQVEAEFLRRYGYDPIEETDRLLDAPFLRSATLWPFAHWL
ncbi:MAG: Gfo/Idh/MocA family oxidoreductase [bacterium]|nr:Gfo/Idh/MocA family oxidoreductase [bacterium]